MDKIIKDNIFDVNLNNNKERSLPPLVVKRAKSAGIVGEEWLSNLNSIILELEETWNISVGEALSGGTHAFVAYADGENGEKYILKIDMPENLGGEFSRGIEALKIMDGRGYAKLYAYDLEKKACLLERLGKPINQLNYSVFEQLHIICSTLKKTWEIPIKNIDFPSGMESVVWFREFIGETWDKLNRPCSRKVIEQAFSFLQSREEDINPSEFVLLHGDAHGGNLLKLLSDDDYKLIDPDGIFYEKAYDLGVLMREWVEEYEQSPLEKGKQRCRYLHHLTGVPEQAIWEWGYLQIISTAFVLLQIGQEKTGQKMLRVAECWACENTKSTKKPENLKVLIELLTLEYGFQVKNIVPAKRGFYGETWEVQTEKEKYFVKIDKWTYHQKIYQNSLDIVQYITDSGISFVPKIIKTKDDKLCCNTNRGIIAVFEYVQGEVYDCCPVERLYNHLTKIYQLNTDIITLKAETFDTEIIHTFHNLKNSPKLSIEVKKAFDKKDWIVSKYEKRLKIFSALCKENKKNFYITHGDAGGNCLLQGNQFFLVDWDTVMLAPVERDAWVYICEKQSLDKINAILAQNGINYTLEQNRLCYYCYYFYFYYLNEYLKSILSTENEKQKVEIIQSLCEYLDNSWIHKRLDIANSIKLII